MLMYNPPRPGEVIKKLCLEPLVLSITEAAKALGVSRKTLSGILNRRTGISPRWPYDYPLPLTPPPRAG
jgi:addiction module HigA family antidote